jgi:hypothetical protein
MTATGADEAASPAGAGTNPSIEAAKREILSRVAAGTLSTDEAAEQLDRLDHPAAPTGSEGSDAQAHTDVPGRRPADDEGRVGRVRISGTFRSIQVVGDPDVVEAVAEGPHRAHREGGTLVIESDADDDGRSNFAFSTPGGLRQRLMVGVGGHSLRPVTVRMHPSIPLEAELGAGTLSIRGVRSPIRARVSAGTVRAEGVSSPIDIAASAGSVSVRGVLDQGESRIECDAGKVRVALEPGSSVKVHARAEIGKVDIPSAGGAGASEWLLGGGQDATIGGGDGTLSVKVSMGAIQVTSEQ